MRIFNAFLYARASVLYPQLTPGKNVEVIKMPVAITDKIKKIRKKDEEKQAQLHLKASRRGQSDIAVISCKRKDFNHYYSQTYGKFEALPLASKGWFNKRSSGDYFVINSYGSLPSWNFQTEANEAGHAQGFEEIGIERKLIKNLNLMGIEKPTNIQALSMPHVLAHRNVLCCAETGSGKTLAYLLPLLHQILQIKEQVPNIPPNTPLGLVLVPGRELGEQIGRVATNVCKGLPIQSKTLIGREKTEKYLQNPTTESVDIMIGTLGVVKSLTTAGLYHMELVRHVVIDEVDTMLDDSFSRTLSRFLHKFPFQQNLPTSLTEVVPGTVQLTMVGATLPKDTSHILQGVVPEQSLYQVRSSYLHRLLPHVPQKFIRLRPKERPVKIVELVKSDILKKKRVLIFTRKNTTCNWLYKFLMGNGVECVNFNGDLVERLRTSNYDKFCGGEVYAMASTDLGSRGLDMPHVQHVINYDMPDNISDYIHRVGRIGRVGSSGSGHVTNLIAAPWEVEQTQTIETAIRKITKLPNVDANIKKKLILRAIEKEEEELAEGKPRQIEK